MPGTTPNNAFRYPLATEAPDGPGAILALATDVDNLVTQGSWAPGIGGGSGATLGTGGSSDGRFSRIGKHVSAKGRLLFGSGGSFGTGTATVTGLPITISTSWSTGYGIFIPPTGTWVPVMFNPIDGANMGIRPIKSTAAVADTGLGSGFDLGTPGQSAILLFTLDLTAP